MKISYNWLKQYVKTDKSPEEIAKILTDTGLEVDGIEKLESVQGGLQKVVVGEVLTCEKHPNADKLKVTTVRVDDSAPLQIVCGAQNVAAGQKVIVATVGATLYPKPDEAFKIKLSAIRGVESQGMLCAEDELGLGESHDGILVLDPETPIGLSAASYFELEDDYQIEIGLTPNRADAMGHIGVARDLVAYLNVHEDANIRVEFPKLENLEVKNNALPISVRVDEEDLCPRYAGISLTNVQVKASPAWLQKRLRAVGLSPINNVVDCTNYVMRELGTPLHAFDADFLNGNIVVKKAEKGSKLVTLDGVERTLDETNLVISNGKENLAIAGVLGGLEGGISDTTTNIFIESAYFNPVFVRKTAKMHGLNTDASFRYERGVDINLTQFALQRVVNLIQEVAGGEISMELVDKYPSKFENIRIHFSLKKCETLIGTSISTSIIEQILSNLDISIIEKNEDSWTLEVPPYRVDVLREVDVIEEILRIYGFNNVPLPEKLNTTLSFSSKPNVEKIQASLTEMLVGIGFSEMMNNSLTRSTYVQKLGKNALLEEHNVSMLNPLSQELDVMRQTLLFSALEVVAHNQNRQNPNLRLAEFGKTYKTVGGEYIENKRLILVVSGDKFIESWNTSSEKSTFYTLKGIVSGVLDRLGLKSFLQENALNDSILEDGIQLSILKKNIGEIGWITKSSKKLFGIKQDVFVADLDWDAIVDSLKLTKVIYKEIPKTFEVRRDFSLLLDKQVTFAEIEKIAKQVDKKILKSVNLFDVYEGEKLEENKKSYAVSFFFQDAEKTLKDEQIDALMLKIRSELESKLAAQLR